MVILPKITKNLKSIQSIPAKCNFFDFFKKLRKLVPVKIMIKVIAEIIYFYQIQIQILIHGETKISHYRVGGKTNSLNCIDS